MTKEEIKNAVMEGIEEKLGGFFVEREQHYQHHLFLQDVITKTNKIKNTACSTVTNVLVMAFVGLLLLGFVFWNKSNGGH